MLVTDFLILLALPLILSHRQYTYLANTPHDGEDNSRAPKHRYEDVRNGPVKIVA
jgi:hypothetical protein